MENNKQTQTKETKNYVSNSRLLEAGVQFGHQTDKWNPKMKPYIHKKRKNIHIIDLEKTKQGINSAYEFLKKQAKLGEVIFVSTKVQAADAIKEEAERAQSLYVTSRWLGGTLSNFKTIRKRINRMFDIEKMEKDQTFDRLPKKEVIKIKKEYERLNKFLSGIKTMKKMPSAIITFDTNADAIAIKEANKLNIPVISIIDTNSNPDGVNYPIPANDDAIRSLSLIAKAMANAICEAKGLEIQALDTEVERKFDNNFKKRENNSNNFKKEYKKPEIKKEAKEEPKETKEKK